MVFGSYSNNGEGIGKETHYTLVRLFSGENVATPPPIFLKTEISLFQSQTIIFTSEMAISQDWTIFTIVLLPSGVHDGEFAFFPIPRLFGLVSFIAKKTLLNQKKI